MTKCEIRNKNIEMVLKKGYQFLLEEKESFHCLTKIKMAEITGLSVRSINRYFKTWDEMIQGIYLLGYELFLKLGREKLKELDYSHCNNGLEKLKVNLKHFKNSNKENSEMTRFLTGMELYLVSIKYEESFLRKLDDMYLQYKSNGVREFFEEGQKDGSINNKLTFKEIMDYYFFFTCSITYNRMQLPLGDSFKGENAKCYLKAIELREKLMIKLLTPEKD